MKKITAVLLLMATISIVSGQTSNDIGSVIVKNNLVLIKTCVSGNTSTYYEITGSPMDDYWFTMLMKMREITDDNLKFEWVETDNQTVDGVVYKKLISIRLWDDGGGCN